MSDKGSGSLPEFTPEGPHALRLPSLPHRLEVVERMLGEAILAAEVGPYRPRAQFTFFCGAEPEEISGYDAQLEAVGRCLDWFVFDYVIPEAGMTPAQIWVERGGGNLSAAEREQARRCLDFRLSLFEVREVEAGRSFRALDLLREDVVEVREDVVTHEIGEGQLLIGRMFPCGEAMVLSGMAAFMNATARAQLEGLFAEGKLKKEELLKRIDGVELENLFGRRVGDIEMIEDVDLLEGRLCDYVERVNPGRLTFEELEVVADCHEDAPACGAEVCESLEITERHELEVVMGYMVTYWERLHG